MRTVCLRPCSDSDMLRCLINCRIIIIIICCVGVDLVRKALRIPCYTIASNAGVDAQEVVTRVMQEKEEIGYDAMHDQYVDMMKSGIIDPTKVWTQLS